MILADIASGEVDWADIFFLIGVILSIIAAVFFFTPTRQLGHFLLSLAVGCIALGFLLL